MFMRILELRRLGFPHRGSHICLCFLTQVATERCISQQERLQQLAEVKVGCGNKILDNYVISDIRSVHIRKLWISDIMNFGDFRY